MKKIKVLLSIWILFLFMYNMIVFLIPVERTKSFFIAYGFSMVFSLTVAGVTLIECGSNRKVKSRFLDLDVAFIGLIGLFLQIVWGLVGMVFYAIPVWLVALVCVILFCTTGVLMLMTGFGVSWIKIIDEKSTKQIQTVKMWEAALKVMELSLEDLELREEIGRVSEILKYTDPVSCSSTQEIDQIITNKLEELHLEIEGGKKEDIRGAIRRIGQLVKKREIQSKTGK